MARQRDLQYGSKAIRRLLREMDQPEGLAHLYATAILAQAVRNASSRPTPQAPMAARNMKVEGADIFPRSAGGSPAAVAFGSEFGSHVYKQFQRSPNPKGYWLYPAAEATSVLAAADEGLEQLLEQVVNG
jgi:hypothetical protein